MAAFLTALEVGRSFFHGLAYHAALTGTAGDRLQLLPKAVDHVLAQARAEEAKSDRAFGERFADAMASLAKAFKLAAGSIEAADHAEEVAFFLAVRAALGKMENGRAQGREREPRLRDPAAPQSGSGLD